MLCLPRAAPAEEVEPLPADFLEYLANFESDDDDWTLFTDEDAKEKAAKTPDQRPRTPPPPAKTEEGDKL